MSGDGEELVYELGELTEDERTQLEGLLEAAGLERAWEGTDLVVAPADERAVEALLERVLPEEDELVYDLEGWDDERRRALVERLRAAGVEHAWEPDGGLVVPAGAEEVVEGLLDDVEWPHALPAEEADVDADGGVEVLSQLFLAADALVRDPLDPDALAAVAALDEGGGLAAAPWGISEGEWGEVRALAASLAAAAVEEAPDPEAVAGQAADLRHRLRGLV